MTRWLLFAALIVVLTVAASVAPLFMPSKVDVPETRYRADVKLDGPRPKLDVNEKNLVHDFGVMPLQTKASHTWTVKNVGDKDMVIRKGDSSCSCTIANLPEGKTELTMKPGDEILIKLEWDTRDSAGPFSKYASILTTDPLHDKVDFVIKGTVRPAIVVLPESTISFDSISNDEDHSQRVVIYSPDKSDLEITEIRNARSDFLKVKKIPLTKQDLESLAGYEKASTQSDDVKRFKGISGYQLEFTIPKGMPIGPFREEIFLTLNHPKHGKQRLTVYGEISGPISLSPESIRMTQVSGTRGASEVISIYVRGITDAHFTVKSIPHPLVATVTKVGESAGNEKTPKGSRYKLTVSVPAGSKAATIKQRIILETDHPEAPELIIPVHVIIR